MKKMMLLALVLTLLFTGHVYPADLPQPAVAETLTDQVEAKAVIYPETDATMEDLTNATISVSLNEGDVYVDDTGTLQMNVTIYAHDLYDLLDVIALETGSVIVTHDGEVTITAIEQRAGGLVCINGGVEAGGLTLVPHDSGFYYAVTPDNTHVWYEVGKATLCVSSEFVGYDNADPELGEDIFYSGSFLVGEVTNYDFTPDNTTIRIEDGQVVELHRAYMP